MKRTTVLAAAVVTIAALPSTGSAAPVNSGEVTLFHGIGGATIGMSRARVVSTLGRPLQESAFGVMSYSSTGIFDISLTRPGRRGHARQFVAVGTGFCAHGVPGACSLKPGSVRAMLRAYPRKFRRVVDVTRDTIYWWCGRVQGRAVSSSFNVDPRRGVILTWYIVNHGKRCPTIAQVRKGR
ncbi:MAG: hypothetical protein KDC36_07410 [Thermoleophilia bacterium]|nr:hypothetical protein [Thermoleophilia bacterium]